MVVLPVLCRRFIGRIDELAFLEEKRRDAARSHGSLILIGGEPGIGKSRLMATFCSNVGSRWRVAFGQCLEYTQRPYGPILDVLGRLEGSGFAELPPAATKREQLDAIVDRFARAAEKSGVVAVIEDLHWADTATLELLTALAPKLEKLRILVLASFRPNEMSAEHASHVALARLERAARSGRIDLAPFEGSELRAFIDEALCDHRLSDETRRTIAGASDGNPFFIEELLKVAVERAAAPERRRSGGTALPASVRATLLERWFRLDDGDRAVVAQAAVIGRSFDIELLARTLETPQPDVLGTLRRARDVQLVEEAPGEFRFRHALTRDAIYSSFLDAQAAPLHRKIALAIEALPEEKRPLEGLAYHWWAAHDDDRSLRYNLLAASAAAVVHAHEDAISFYLRALESQNLSHVERGDVLTKLAERINATGATERAHRTLEEAADAYAAAGAYESEAACRLRAAATAYGLHYPEPMKPLEVMLARLDPSEYVARSRVHLGLAWVKATIGFPSESGEHLRLVDERARELRGDIAMRYHNVAAWNAMMVGDLPGFRSEFAAWVAAAPAGPLGALAAAHLNGSQCFAFFGLHAEAAAHVEAALTVVRRERNVFLEESTHAFAVGCYFLSGDLVRAREALAHVSPTTDSQVTLHQAAAWGMLAALALGDDDLANEWFETIEHTAVESIDEMCVAGYAEILVRRGRARDVPDFLRRALPPCERMRGIMYSLLAVARYGHPADVDRARTSLAISAESPWELPERHALDLFDAYVALRASNPRDAVAPARRAAEGFARLGFPLLEAASYEAAGDVEAALARYEAAGALGDVRRLRPAGSSADGAAPASARARPDPSALSAREREIVLMVAAGASNREIAERLDISAKTVEKHLGSVYRKLGIASRARLAVYASVELERASFNEGKNGKANA
ncbi:MAG: AAA family ATPase [Candidatus Eremiobacteraeota bacterium]|nr:AAA family ATPase [Candidatus Eremiobacteraeota bacterium]